jgi:hypothetical protein
MSDDDAALLRFIHDFKIGLALVALVALLMALPPFLILAAIEIRSQQDCDFNCFVDGEMGSVRRTLEVLHDRAWEEKNAREHAVAERENRRFWRQVHDEMEWSDDWR